MELKVMSFDGEASGSVHAVGRDLRARAAHRHPAALRHLAARQAPRRHPQGQEPRRDLPHRQEDVPPEGHRLRPPRFGAREPVPRRRPFVRSGGAQPRDRPAEEGARARAQACALGQGQGRRHHRRRQGHRRRTARPRRCAANFEKLGLTNALIIDGAAVDAGFAQAARNIPNVDVLPVQGINVYDILRRQKLVLTKAALEALEARFK